MANFMDYLGMLAGMPTTDSATGDQNAPTPAQPQPTAPPVVAPAPATDPTVAAAGAPLPVVTAPADSPNGATVTQAAPPLDAATQAQADAGIPVNAPKQPPAQGVGFKLPLTAADQDVAQYQDPDPNASKAPHATPQELASMQDLQDLPDHKGAFGQKGTLRKILGTLGDAFLIQGGAHAMYAPKVQQEKESDALVGFAAHPQDSIGRLAAVNPEAAIKLQATLANQDLAQGRINQASQKMGAVQGARNAIQYGNFANALKLAKSPQEQATIIAQAKAFKAQSGLSDDVAPDLTPDNAGGVAQGLAPKTVAQSLGTQIRQQTADTGAASLDERVRNDKVNNGLGQENANSRATSAAASMKNANRPHPGPNPTDASMAAPILAKLQAGQTLTSGDQEVLTRLGKGITGKAKAGGLGGLPTTPGAPAAASSATPVTGHAPAAPGLSTNPPAFKANGWLYDANHKPIRKI